MVCIFQFQRRILMLSGVGNLVDGSEWWPLIFYVPQFFFFLFIRIIMTLLSGVFKKEWNVTNQELALVFAIGKVGFDRQLLKCYSIQNAYRSGCWWKALGQGIFFFFGKVKTRRTFYRLVDCLFLHGLWFLHLSLGFSQ